MKDIDDIDSQREDMKPRRNSGGGSVRMHDPRVTKGIAITIALFQAGIIGVGSWIAIAMMNLRDSVIVLGATYTVQYQAVVDRLNKGDAHDERQDDNISQLQKDVSIVQGKVLRGEVDEFGLTPDKPKQVQRGH